MTVIVLPDFDTVATLVSLELTVTVPVLPDIVLVAVEVGYVMVISDVDTPVEPEIKFTETLFVAEPAK